MNGPVPGKVPVLQCFVSAVVRTVVLLVVWWALTEGDAGAVAFGLWVVPLIVVLWWRLFPPERRGPRLLASLAFGGYFLCGSVAAGLDVARRLLSPRLPMSPGYLTYTTSLPAGSPRWLLANTLSLLPGTLSVTLRGPQLELHCLDTTAAVSAAVGRAEMRIARMFPQ
ncbi:MAG TPA: cation:proton antiporter [Halieaceae bacterium]|jgi:multicomponent Na+:H+ antiporter subunit E|nr:cation:proton antiporter [Haliea sp.]MAY94410.1 cation:proton antiporter [Haliea sp.]MBP69751.1 cation:proton antiporter [Haliea sp.]HBQ40636.1 cation:proton antiporter [Halieaceae bacterium]HCD55436.1 cation:proton antiporter [Halieaceae bacterium]|tara:strand:- start:11853 stop:12356 length:504 start_codon:yes stop_codon:yes gene_type:complete